VDPWPPLCKRAEADVAGAESAVAAASFAADPSSTIVPAGAAQWDEALPASFAFYFASSFAATGPSSAAQ